MLGELETSLTGGESGDSEQPDPSLAGWAGDLAHPDAPAGGGGPGGFAAGGPAGAVDVDAPAAGAPGPLQVVPTAAPAPTPPNPPPATNARSLGSKKRVQNSLMDVSIDAEIAADGHSTSGTHTSFNTPTWQAPGFSADGSGNITSFDGKFVWRGTIRIKTRYGGGANASQLSCYGRGTTDADVDNRDITLGFHENNHQQDYENYLDSHDLPDPPALRVGMSTGEYRTETTNFGDALQAYTRAMRADSLASTDEVGHRKSTWQSTGTCFVHIVP